MHTRNSPPQAKVTLSASALPDVTPKAVWIIAEEFVFIDYIANHKAEAGDAMKFKPSFWTGAAELMLLYATSGGPKTASGCAAKWDWLKKAYNVVSVLKKLSGFTWSDNKGLNIKIMDKSAWAEYVAKNKDVQPFKTKGFAYFSHIQKVMPSTVRGIHAFRPSQQTHGAIANLPYSGPSTSATGAGAMLPPPSPTNHDPESSNDKDTDAMPPPSV